MLHVDFCPLKIVQFPSWWFKNVKRPSIKCSRTGQVPSRRVAGLCRFVILLLLGIVARVAANDGGKGETDGSGGQGS